MERSAIRRRHVWASVGGSAVDSARSLPQYSTLRQCCVTYRSSPARSPSRLYLVQRGEVPSTAVYVCLLSSSRRVCLRVDLSYFQEGGKGEGDEGHGHDDDGEAKHGGHEGGDTDGAADDGHDSELDDSMSLSVSASHAPQHRHQQKPPQPGQPGATVAEMMAPESPQQVRVKREE